MNSHKLPWDLDIRVRDRNVAKGLLDQKDVDKHIKELPDVSAHADLVTIPQPAVPGER
jgi:hypothetical protein